MEREEYSQGHKGAVGNKKLATSKAPQGITPKQIKFKVSYASGEDPEFVADELNTHSPQTKGWQSPPFCEYPQEIGLEFLVGDVQLSQLQILSHESKIATKIDVFVGRGNNYENCTFKRLGHLSLDDNERSNFAARELKSVYIGKQGQFLKLLIHKCHLNRHNIYNQTGIIAINVLGFPATGEAVSRGSSRGAKFASSTQRAVPPLEDLAFDMNFDEHTANIIRDLHQQKEHAVEREDFELAKAIKRAEDQLKQFGMKIAGLENAKREAVQREDYDEAAHIKKEVVALRDEVNHLTASILHGGIPSNDRTDSARFNSQRQHGRPDPIGAGRRQPNMEFHPNQNAQANFNNSMGSYQNGNQFTSNNFDPNANTFDSSQGRSGSARDGFRPHGHFPERDAFESPDGYQDEEHFPQYQQGYGMEDERPLPVHQKSPGPSQMFDGADDGRSPFNQGVESHQPEEDMPHTDPEVIERALGKVTGFEDLPEAESLPVGLGAEAQPLVEVFGEYLVRCIYSRQVKLRVAAFQALNQDIDSYNANDSRTFSSFMQVCRLAVGDKSAAVAVEGVKVLKAITSQATGLRRQDLGVMEPLFSSLVDLLGNNTAKLQQNAQKSLLHMASLKQIGPGGIASAVMRQPRQGKPILWKHLLGRVHLITEFLHEFGLKEEMGLGLETIMSFVSVNNGLANPNVEVREATKVLVMQIYTFTGEAVLPYLKELRPKQMEEYQQGFDQVDQNHGRPVKAPQGNSAMKVSPMSKGKFNEPNSARSNKSSVGKKVDKPLSARGANDESKSREGKEADVNININVNHDPKPKDRFDDDEEDEDDVEPFTCQFCSRYDEAFTDDALDMHYWKECPMLVSCPQCDQIIEVALLNNHLLTECENKDNHKQCPRCSEAIAAQFFDQHVQRASCLPVKAHGKGNRCPLCHKDCKPGEEGWRQHLLLDLCPKNTRTAHLKSSK